MTWPSGRVGNPVCGDLMEMYVRVKDDRIADIKFQTFGCGSAVATSSMITELVMGKTLDEALEVTRADVADALDGLPPVKMHCSNLAADALHDAINNWRSGTASQAARRGGDRRGGGGLWRPRGGSGPGDRRVRRARAVYAASRICPVLADKRVLVARQGSHVGRTGPRDSPRSPRGSSSSPSSTTLALPEDLAARGQAVGRQGPLPVTPAGGARRR